MQELDKQIALKKTIEIVKPVEQKQEYKFVGNVRLVRGLKFWEFNIDTEELKEVEVVLKKVLDISKEEHSIKKAVYNSKSYYFQALNRKNAIKKVNKRIEQTTGIKDYIKE